MRVVLVTGSRDWPSAFTVYEVLSAEARTAWHDGEREMVVMHGACPRGADQMASDWCMFPSEYADLRVIEERHPADWGNLGKAAGFIRNQEMVDTAPHICLAFIKDNSRGATHCAGRAERAGIPVKYYRA